MTREQRKDAYDKVRARQAAEYRQKAKALYHREGELEIDDNAAVSAGGDDGAYVQAWIWVPASESVGPKK